MRSFLIGSPLGAIIKCVDVVLAARVNEVRSDTIVRGILDGKKCGVRCDVEYHCALRITVSKLGQMWFQKKKGGWCFFANESEYIDTQPPTSSPRRAGLILDNKILHDNQNLRKDRFIL